MERPSTSKPRGVCKYFSSNSGCFHGDKCKFLHGADETLTPYDKSKSCKYFAAGYCRRGDQCWFAHQVNCSSSRSAEASAAALVEPTISDDVYLEECGICYEKPATYGLLSGCSHAFCLKCLREWRDRSGKSEDVVVSGNTKKCPLCRTPSLFITPSSHFFPSGHPRKVEIIDKYKASMARVPCRYFQKSPSQRRFCPFGRDCFYQHKGDDGTSYVFDHGAEYYLSHPLRNDGRRVTYLSDIINDVGTEYLRDVLQNLSSSQFRNVVGTIRQNLSAVVRSNIREIDRTIRPEDMDRVTEETVSDFVDYLEVMHNQVLNDNSGDEEISHLNAAESNGVSIQAPVPDAIRINVQQELFPGATQSESPLTQPTNPSSSRISDEIALRTVSPRFSTSVRRQDSVPFPTDNFQQGHPARPSTISSLLRATSPPSAANAVQRNASEPDFSQNNDVVAVSGDPGTHSDSRVHAAVENVLQETNGTLRDLNSIERSIIDTLGTDRETADMTDEEARNFKDLRPTRTESGYPNRRPIDTSCSIGSMPSFVTDGRGRVIRTMDYEREQEYVLSPPCDRISLPRSPPPAMLRGLSNPVPVAPGMFITDGHGRVVGSVEELSVQETTVPRPVLFDSSQELLPST